MFSSDAQALMAAAVDAIIVIDHHGTIQAVNDSACRIFGYRTDELLGEKVGMLMIESDREAHDAYMRNHLETGRTRIIGIGRQVSARRRDGSVFPASLSVGKVPRTDPPRFVGLIRDVSADVEATNALKLERDRSLAYLELNEAILMSLDPDGRVLEVNARGAEILGSSAPGIVGRDWLSFVRGDIEAAKARLMLSAALSTGETGERELDAADTRGAPRRIRWRCIGRRAADGSPAGWLCSGEDLTERARRAEESQIAQQRLTHVARLATVGEMATGVAHELSQPLTAITTYARATERYLSMQHADLDEARAAVREIAVEGMRAGAIIARLRQLVRTDGTDSREPTDLNALISELQPMLAAEARIHESKLRISLTPRLPRVMAQPAQLQQVVLNLSRNAFEALLENPPGNRQVEISTVHFVDGQVELRVTDNGSGVDPGVAERLFHPFATTKQSGTGLGLVMSHTLVKSHGGTIGHRAVTPHGTTFYVQLPAVEGKHA